MYLSDRVIFVQMPKTGCSHIARLLMKFDGGRVVGQHQPFSDISKKSDRIIAISCRNPWDWYVSLWAQGCRKRGLGDLYYALAYDPIEDLKTRARSLRLYASARSIARILTKGAGNRDVQRRFSELYEDAYSEINFRKWLSLLMTDPATIRSIPDGYFESETHNYIGLMTYTFLRLSTDYSLWESRGRHLASFDQVREFSDQANIVEKFIKMEMLNEDLKDLLNSVGINVSVDDLVMRKDNSSTHMEYRRYYDEQSFMQVKQAERFLVEKFGYSF